MREKVRNKWNSVNYSLNSQRIWEWINENLVNNLVNVWMKLGKDLAVKMYLQGKDVAIEFKLHL